MTTDKDDFANRRAVLLTPVGRGAVATVLAEGFDVASAVATWFRPSSGRPVSEFPVGRIVYGRWGGAEEVGEELVVCLRSDLQIEIHCHGGVSAAERILHALASSGFPTFDWREWVHSRQSEPFAAGAARVALAEARTERAARILLDQYQGALQSAIDRAFALREEGRLEESNREIEQVLRYEGVGLHLAAPWRVVLSGSPNVGKSSLANALLGFERSIVFDQPGTTRDVLTSLTAVDGWPVQLIDTAGLCETTDDIETQGIARAREQVATADLALLVFDASHPWSPEDAQLAATHPAALLIHNKHDLVSSPDTARPAGLSTSATTGVGIPELLSAISQRLVPDPPPPGAAVPFTREQVTALCQMLEDR